MDELTLLEARQVARQITEDLRPAIVGDFELVDPILQRVGDRWVVTVRIRGDIGAVRRDG